MGWNNATKRMEEAVAWQLGARPVVTFFVALVSMLLAGAMPLYWVSQHPFPIRTPNETLQTPSIPEYQSLVPIAPRNEPVTTEPVVEVPASEPPTVREFVTPNLDTRPAPPVDSSPVFESPPMVESMQPIEAPEDQEANPRPEEAVPSTSTIIHVPPQLDSNVAEEPGAAPIPQVVPEVISIPMPPPAPPEHAPEAEEAIFAATTAAAAAVARFAREDRSATRNAEYIAGDVALARAIRHYDAKRYSEALDEALAARRKFDQAKPEPWDKGTIVIQN